MFKRIIVSRYFFWLFPLFIFLASCWSISLFVNFPIVSPIFHFSGGVAMAIVFFHFWETRPAIYFLKRYPLLNFIFAISFVALIGVLWEFYEFLTDVLLPIMPILHPVIAQPSLADTMADFFFDLLGSVTVCLTYYLSFVKEVPAISFQRSAVVATSAIHKETSQKNTIKEV